MSVLLQGVPKNCAPKGDVDSIVSLFTRLNRSSVNLEFETLFESI